MARKCAKKSLLTSSGKKHTVNPFPLKLGAYDYKLQIADVEVATGRFTEGQKLAAGSELQFTITRFLGRDDHHDLAKKLLRASVISYRLASKLTAEDRPIEVPVDGEIRFGQR